jgi:hypothetical protein
MDGHRHGRPVRKQVFAKGYDAHDSGASAGSFARQAGIDRRAQLTIRVSRLNR